MILDGHMGVFQADAKDRHPAVTLTVMPRSADFLELLDVDEDEFLVVIAKDVVHTAAGRREAWGR